ncbi:MAG: 1-acyl-sn-glycerol-3-phosphate acyltransferase [Eggerthellaceae bacterium]|nr:1-acyl-sn-glycerol-3-phosphate acyltransferase [Eggerthellaceae bacterium]
MEQMWDSPLGGLSREKEIPHGVGNFLYGVLFAVCKIAFRYRVEGIENLRGFYQKSGVVLVCNHTSFLDTVFLYLSVRPTQWARFFARDDLFDNAGGFFGHVISRVGAFPVKRNTADLTAIKRAARMLKNCEVVGVYPEGTRRGRGTKPSEIHSGVAMIARMGKAPLLPMTVRDAELIKQKGKFVRFPKVTVEFGAPLLLSDFDILPKEERLDACSWYVMRECFALSLRCPADEVDMVVLFPTSKDYAAFFRQHPIAPHTTEELLALQVKAPASAATPNLVRGGQS